MCLLTMLSLRLWTPVNLWMRSLLSTFNLKKCSYNRLTRVSSPEAKYDNTSGVAALVGHSYVFQRTLRNFIITSLTRGHSADECLKSAGYLQEVLSDPSWSASGDPAKTPFTRAFKIDIPIWEWMEQPNNSLRLRRFGAAMTSLAHATLPGAIKAGMIDVHDNHARVLKYFQGLIGKSCPRILSWLMSVEV